MPAVDEVEGRILSHSNRPLAEVWKGYTHFADGDVIFAKITPCMENGKIAIAEGLTNGLACGSTEFHVFRPQGAALAPFLHRFLRQQSYRDDAEAAMTGAVGQRRVPRDFIANTAFPLPPLPEQHRIVAKIDSLFARSSRARDELAHIPRLIERYRQAVLEAAFRGDLTADWRATFVGGVGSVATAIRDERRAWWASIHGDRKQYVSPASCSADDLYKLPSSWEWMRAEESCAFITKGTTPEKSTMTVGGGDIPYIKVYNLTFTGELDFTIDPTFVPRVVHDEELARSRVIPGDILMNIVGPPLGKVSIVPDDYPEWNINQAIAIFRRMPSLDLRYLAYWLSSAFAINWSVSRAKATAGQSNLTLEICRDIPIPIPPLVEQCRAVVEIDRHFTAIKNCSVEFSHAEGRLATLDQSILDKAFTGKLVPQDPADEPASKLLDRIKATRESAPKAKRGRRSAS